MQNDPITVPASAGPYQLGAALRQLLIAVGAYMAGRGWIDAGIASAAVPVILIAVPMLWSQWIVRRNTATARALADALPDAVARAK